MPWVVVRYDPSDTNHDLPFYLGKKFPKSPDLDRKDGWHANPRFAAKFKAKLAAETAAIMASTAYPPDIGRLIVKRI